MSSTTENLGLHKIDLNDAPPDITVLNQNWDIIDEEVANISENITPEAIGAVDKTGDVMSGSLTVIDNFNVNKTFDDVEYKTYVRPINYSIGNNGDYSTGLIHYKGNVNHAQLMFNKDGIMLRDNVNAKAYKLFGQHNADDLTNVIKSLLTGGEISMVKSVQRGVVTVNTATSKDVSINAVNPNKSFVNVSTSCNSTYYTGIYLSAFTSNKLTFTNQSNSGGVTTTLSYEVVEFY